MSEPHARSPRVLVGGEASSSDDDESELVSKPEGGTCGLCCSKVHQYPKLFVGSLLLVIVGIVMFMMLENWTFTSAVYVIVQIITTIGYGDITVSHDASRFAMALYVVACLIVIANFVSFFTTVFVEASANMVRKRLREAESTLADDVADEEDAKRKFANLNKLLFSVLLFASMVLFGTIFYALTEACDESYGMTYEAACPSNHGQTFQSCPSTCYSLNWVQAFYMSVITMTTVGFGDFAPRSRLGRWVGIVWMLVGVASTAFFITSVSEYALASKEHFEDEDDISEEIFKKMDQGKTGFITRAEYRTYVLIKHGLIDQDTIDQIDEKYDSMDLNGNGKITFRMIKSQQKVKKRERSKVVE